MTKYQELSDLWGKVSEERDAKDKRIIGTFREVLKVIRTGLAPVDENRIDFVEEPGDDNKPFKPAGGPSNALRFDGESREYHLLLRVMIDSPTSYTHFVNRLAILPDESKGLMMRVNDHTPVNITGNRYDALVTDVCNLIRQEIERVGAREKPEGKVYSTARKVFNVA
jgi:hypothetical protein